MNIVTSAANIIGIHLISELLRRGEQVCAFIDSQANTDEIRRIINYYNVNDAQLSLVRADISDIQDVINDNVAIIYHCADLYSPLRSDAERMWNANVIGTRRVAQFAQNQGARLCYISTTEALGFAEHDAAVDESTPWQPDSNRTIYAKSKFYQEMEVWRAINEGLQAIIFCSAFAIGPSTAQNDKSSAVLRALTSDNQYYGRNAFVDARDLASIAIDAANNDKFLNDRFIIAPYNINLPDIQSVINNIYDARGLKTNHNAASNLSMKIAKFFGDKEAATHLDINKLCDEKHNFDMRKFSEILSFDFRSIDESIDNLANFTTQKIQQI